MDLEAQVNAFPYWYHRIELPGGVVTPGWAPRNPDHYFVPQDLSGLRILDVGAWDGYWSFTALQRGAREVVAIDDFSDHVGQNIQRKAWDTFDLCRAAFGYDDSRCRRLEMNVYDISKEELGVFDVVFFFGTLYHLRHPLLALDTLSLVCSGSIFVETAVIDDYSPYRGGLNQGYTGKQMVMEFYPGAELGQNNTNWWAPTTYCLAHMVQAAGFKGVKAWKLPDEPEKLSECRGFATGTKSA